MDKCEQVESGKLKITRAAGISKGKMMKTIGLLGGMSWESTLEYYRILNDTVKERLGGLHSARCLLYSVEFGEMAGWMASAEWHKVEAVLIDAAKKLKLGGADFIVICTNTMHKMAEAVSRESGLELLHIADATAEALKAGKVDKAILLGTKPTMEQDFYRAKLAGHGIGVLIPSDAERDELHRIIFEELCRGEIKESSREYGQKVTDRLSAEGAGGVILGCTELGLLFRQEDNTLPLFDTALIHARAAALKALAE